MLACLQGKINRILFNCFPHLSGESHASQIFRASRVSSEAKKSRGETDKNTSWKFIHFQILCSSLLLHWIFSIAAHLAFDEHRNQRWFFASHINVSKMLFLFERWSKPWRDDKRFHTLEYKLNYWRWRKVLQSNSLRRRQSSEESRGWIVKWIHWKRTHVVSRSEFKIHKFWG